MKPWKNLKWQHSIKRRFTCRCKKCSARVTREKHPDVYKVEKYSKCPFWPSCRGSLTVDWYRMWKPNVKKDRGEVCNCDGYPHPHRKGSLCCFEREDEIIKRSLKDKVGSFINKAKEGEPWW